MNTRRLFYIYSYLDGMRDRNVGFAKIKMREDNYRLFITLKIPPEYVAETMQICLYKWDNGTILGFKLGTMTPSNETCKYNATIVSAELASAGFSINDVCGVYIFSNEHDRYIFSAEMKEEFSLQKRPVTNGQIQCVC